MMFSLTGVSSSVPTPTLHHTSLLDYLPVPPLRLKSQSGASHLEKSFLIPPNWAKCHI
jgi:hypothetical protein